MTRETIRTEGKGLRCRPANRLYSHDIPVKWVLWIMQCNLRRPLAKRAMAL